MQKVLLCGLVLATAYNAWGWEEGGYASTVDPQSSFYYANAIAEWDDDDYVRTQLRRTIGKPRSPALSKS